MMRSLSGIRVLRGIPVIRADWLNRLLNLCNDHFQLFNMMHPPFPGSIRAAFKQPAQQFPQVNLCLCPKQKKRESFLKNSLVLQHALLYSLFPKSQIHFFPDFFMIFIKIQQTDRMVYQLEQI